MRLNLCTACNYDSRERGYVCNTANAWSVTTSCVVCENYEGYGDMPSLGNCFGSGEGEPLPGTIVS